MASSAVSRSASTVAWPARRRRSAIWRIPRCSRPTLPAQHEQDHRFGRFLAGQLDGERPARAFDALRPTVGRADPQRLDLSCELWPARKTVFTRQHELRVGQLRGARQRALRVELPEPVVSSGIAGGKGLAQVLGLAAVLFEVRIIGEALVGHVNSFRKSPPSAWQSGRNSAVRTIITACRWARPFPRRDAS